MGWSMCLLRGPPAGKRDTARKQMRIIWARKKCPIKKSRIYNCWDHRLIKCRKLSANLSRAANDACPPSPRSSKPTPLGCRPSRRSKLSWTYRRRCPKWSVSAATVSLSLQPASQFAKKSGPFRIDLSKWTRPGQNERRALTNCFRWFKPAKFDASGVSRPRSPFKK